MRTSAVWDEPEPAAMVAAFRAWSEATNAVVGHPRATDWLRDLLRDESHTALAVLATRPLRGKLDFLPELVANLDAPISEALLAADVIRAFPRRALAERLPPAVAAVVGDLSYEGFDQLTSLLVELRDRRSLAVVLEAAGRHDDPDVREIATDLRDVHLDPTMWGLSRPERRGIAEGAPRAARYTVRLLVQPGDRSVERTVVTAGDELMATSLAVLHQARDEPGTTVADVEVTAVEVGVVADPARDVVGGPGVP